MTSDWETYKNDICEPLEDQIFGFSIKNRDLLISGILSNAFLNEKSEFEEMKKIGVDESLETIGDFVLDFIIIDHFTKKIRYTPKQIDDFRQWYGKNSNLHFFSKKTLRLQDYILWGPDEKTKEKWNQLSTKILADRFEMLIGVIYLDQGVKAVKKFLNNINFYDEIDKIKRK